MSVPPWQGRGFVVQGLTTPRPCFLSRSLALSRVRCGTSPYARPLPVPSVHTSTGIAPSAGEWRQGPCCRRRPELVSQDIYEDVGPRGGGALSQVYTALWRSTQAMYNTRSLPLCAGPTGASLI